MTKLSTIPSLPAIVASSFLLAGPAGADQDRPGYDHYLVEYFSVEFEYDQDKPLAGNYAAFRHKALRACSQQGPRPIETMARERECANQILDKLVRAMGRSDLAELHRLRSHAGATAYAAR